MLFIAGTNIKKRKKIHKVFSGKSESNIRKSSEGILKAERNTRIIVKNISINPPFSRHIIAQASLALLIWLNENVQKTCR